MDSGKFLEGLGAAIEEHSKKKEDDKSKSKKSELIEPKDFFWDQFLKYISSAILALTILNITVQFFRDGGVFCFHPSDTISLLSSSSGRDSLAVYEFARDQASFLNSYCRGSIPNTEYFPLYILIHGLLLLLPHYIWSSICKGDFDSFFSIAGRMDRLRDSEIGEYSEENYDRVKKLEKEYGGTNKWMFRDYYIKLLAQLLVCVGSILFSALYLNDFSYTFNCPRMLEEDGVVPDEWPLNITVPCVYTTLRILGVVRYADFALTGGATILALYGIIWCFIRHKDLGYREAAEFAFQSGLKPETYAPPPIFHLKGNRFYGILRENYEMKWVKGIIWLFTRQKVLLRLKHCWAPRIKNNLDLLVLLLFKADAGRGKVFKDIQVCSD